MVSNQFDILFAQSF